MRMGDFNKKNLFAILNVFTEAQQKLDYLKLGDYELKCTAYKGDE